MPSGDTSDRATLPGLLHNESMVKESTEYTYMTTIHDYELLFEKGHILVSHGLNE